MCEFIGMETNRCQRLDCPITKLVMDAETNLEVMAGTVAKLGNELDLARGTADGFEQRLQATERQLRAAQDTICEVKDWLKEARAGWAGSDSEFYEYYGELAEMLGVEFTEELDIEITFKMTARIKLPIGYDLSANDFWVKNQPDIDTQTSEVELLSNEEIYIDDLDINS